MADEFKYIQDSDASCDGYLENSWKDWSEMSHQNYQCDPDPKTYTLKILSEDEMVRIYKPTGEELKCQRE